MLLPLEHISKIDIQVSLNKVSDWDMKLDANENYIGPSTAVMQAIKSIEPTDIAYYPDYTQLYSALSELHKIDFGCIAISNGICEGLTAIISTYLSNSDNIVYVTPTDDKLPYCALNLGIVPIEVPYKNKWIYPFEDIKQKLSDTNVKALYIATPNNPTGDIVSEHYIEDLLSEFPDKLFIIDETYGNFSGYTNVDLVKKYDNVFLIKSCSHDYALAGLRFAYMLSNKENIDNVVKKLAPYNVNVVVAKAVKATLEDTNYIRYVSNEIARSRSYLTEQIRKLGFDVYRSYGNFILVDFKSKADLVFEKLKSNNIIVKNYFGDKILHSHLRITVPTMTASERIVSLLKSRNTLVFEMDNVLFDISESVTKAIKMTYLHFTGKTLSDFDINRMRSLAGSSRPLKVLSDIIKRSGFNFSSDELQKVYESYYGLDGLAYIDNESLLISADILANLAKDYNLAICTERSLQDTMFVLKKYGIMQYFSKIVTADDVPDSLHFPDTTTLLMVKEAFITDYLICFCNTTNFVQSALKFNFSFPVGVLGRNTSSNTQADLLEKNGVKLFVSDFDELLSFVEQNI